MSLPAKVAADVKREFVRLIEEGRAILADVRMIGGGTRTDWVTKRTVPIPRSPVVDRARFEKWRTSCLVLFLRIMQRESPHWPLVADFEKLKARQDHTEFAVARLESLQGAFDSGMLEPIVKAIEAELAADYMGQAEGLLAEGQSGKFDHVPAAVLAGAVLEKALRTLCEQHEPPIATRKDNGAPKMMDMMISELRKAGVFNKTKEPQLRGWAAIRNRAAHGEFEEFTRGDVEEMLSGVNRFLAEHRG